MTQTTQEIFVGQTPLVDVSKTVVGRYVTLFDETYYQIEHSDHMPPFFMSVVSHSDHWLFIASNGGLTAGRTNADSALFPYETEDKIVANADENGSQTIIRVERNGRIHLWEPFSNRQAGVYQVDRHLYKNSYGNKLIFEEVNHDLNLTMRLSWRVSEQYGFVKTGWLQNDGGDACQIALLDGFRNVMPYGTTSLLQTTMSSLLHAYKRSELEPETGMGIFGLSATLTDQAEPSESLKATVVWQVGLEADSHLVSTQQLDAFRYGRCPQTEQETLGKPAAYYATATFGLVPQANKVWHFVADLNQDSAAIAERIHFLKQAPKEIVQQLEADIEEGTQVLMRHVAAADGVQLSAQTSTATHHFANVLFNIMRGGIFADGNTIQCDDLLDFVQIRNQPVLEAHKTWFDALPKEMSIKTLHEKALATGDVNVMRLCYEYLPLTFSRRHGDPSRPWNQFSINLKKEDGSPKLDYQGNWRDIFQNWEPLLFSFPDYLIGVIAKFLNATTADGYNPYRVTRNGIEWEVPEPDNPWANIGYWSDHQIIYLQKLLELAKQLHPGKLESLWNAPIFAYTNVPYRLRPYSDMLKDWYNTIDFDWACEAETKTAVSQIGTDGRLLLDSNGRVLHGTLTEKLLVILLAKLSNLVPDGGIWMNTQRPEWNDANNALVGKGLSVVTTAYLRRFIASWQQQLDASDATFSVNESVATLFGEVQAVFETFMPKVESGFAPESRQKFMDALGEAATTYRHTIYESGLSPVQHKIEASALKKFLLLAQNYIEATLQRNWRPDGLAHAYNILHLDDTGAHVEYLYLMLEGQVAMLSSGMVTPEKGLEMLENLRQSDLYRAEQQSYMLYPNRRLAGFLQKNNIAPELVAKSKLVNALTKAGDKRLISQDREGVFHFNGRFRNVNNVQEVLTELTQEPAYASSVADETSFILNLFEETFNHRQFTGRSGTFFAYEGLGSIYWHMVSKLLLAAQELYMTAKEAGASADLLSALAEAYYDIRDGIGFNKTPEQYGAFPTDPYSHTPMGSGARQPGMTGQVKEEILTRWGELGIALQQGKLNFRPTLLREDEFISEGGCFTFVNVSGEQQMIAVPPNGLAFTLWQLPIVYVQGAEAKIEVLFADGRSEQNQGNTLDKETTQAILNRNAQVKQIQVTVTIT